VTEVQKKDTNPKDAVGVLKWRQLACLPIAAVCYVGAVMFEGATKYGRGNWRKSGIRASVYFDAALGHLFQWWLGEDEDPDSGAPHLAHAAACLLIVLDATIQAKAPGKQDLFNDDRPIRETDLSGVRDDLQKIVAGIRERNPNPVRPYTQKEDGGDDK